MPDNSDLPKPNGAGDDEGAKRDRLAELEENFRRRKHNRTQLFWMKYNPAADYKWDLVDAKEDVEWMIAEIKRLREELAIYKEFTEELKRQLQDEINGN